MKYHDNTALGLGYGEDGTLLDNWNPDREFSDNQYIDVHFRIDCPTFDCHGHFNNAADREAFQREAKSVLDRFGIMESCGYESERAGAIEHLYIHPQDISGAVKMKDVKPIAEALNGCKTFSVRWVDLYEEIHQMTEEEFITRLDAQKQAIEADLMRLYTTKRSNLYIVPGSFSGPEKCLEKQYHIRRNKCQGYNDGPCYEYMVKVRENLVDRGLLVKADTKHGTGYRTVKQATKANKGGNLDADGKQTKIH